MENVNGNYTIETQHSKNRIIVRAQGYFSDDYHEKYLKDIISNVKAMAINNHKIDILFDLIESTPQSQTVANKQDWFAKIMPSLRKGAAAVTSILLKKQIERKPLNSRFRVFETLEDAENWLDE